MLKKNGKSKIIEIGIILFLAVCMMVLFTKSMYDQINLWCFLGSHITDYEELNFVQVSDKMLIGTENTIHEYSSGKKCDAINVYYVYKYDVGFSDEIIMSYDYDTILQGDFCASNYRVLFGKYEHKIAYTSCPGEGALGMISWGKNLNAFPGACVVKNQLIFRDNPASQKEISKIYINDSLFLKLMLSDGVVKLVN